MSAYVHVKVPVLDYDLMMLGRYDRVVSPIGLQERRIAARLFAFLAKRKFVPIAVYDGEEYPECSDAKSAMELMFDLDECCVSFRQPGREEVHGVRFVFGEISADFGEELIADYSYSDGDADGFGAAMEAFSANEGNFK